MDTPDAEADMTLTALHDDDDEAPELSPAMYRALYEHSTDIVTILDADGNWRFTSPAGTRLLGWPNGHDAGPDGIFAFVHPEDLGLARATLAEVHAGERHPDAPVLLRVRSTDGRWHVLETRAQDLRDDPAIRGIVVTCRNVTERREAEAKVELLYTVLERSSELVVICEADGSVVHANQIARDLMGLADGDHLRGELGRMLDAESAKRVEDEITPIVLADGSWTGELTLRTATGKTLPVDCTIQLHTGDTGARQFLSVIAHDISVLKLTQQQLEHQATHDALTGLYNRALFQEMGEQALARANRQGNVVAVLFLDLDRFKPVNDSLGHAAGDELLVQVAHRLRSSLRAGDIVARFGGDEFVVLCEQHAGQHQMRELAGRLIDVLSEPVSVMGWTATVGASVGIAIGGGGRITIDMLIRDADAALYQAKELGRGRAVLFGEFL